jgi:hypothetical protein
MTQLDRGLDGHRRGQNQQFSNGFEAPLHGDQITIKMTNNNDATTAETAATTRQLKTIGPPAEPSGKSDNLTAAGANNTDAEWGRASKDIRSSGKAVATIHFAWMGRASKHPELGYRLANNIRTSPPWRSGREQHTQPAAANASLVGTHHRHLI